MHAHSETRSRARAGQRVPFAFQTALDSHLRFVRPKISAVIQTKAEQPSLCFESRRVVRAGASGRRFRRDVRGLVAAAFELAPSLSRLAGVAQTRIGG